MAGPPRPPAADAVTRARRKHDLTRPGRRRPAKIFAWPALIATATVTGLVAGLVGEGAWNLIAWTGLAVPVIAARSRRT